MFIGSKQYKLFHVKTVLELKRIQKYVYIFWICLQFWWYKCVDLPPCYMLAVSASHLSIVWPLSISRCPIDKFQVSIFNRFIIIVLVKSPFAPLGMHT